MRVNKELRKESLICKAGGGREGRNRIEYIGIILIREIIGYID